MTASPTDPHRAPPPAELIPNTDPAQPARPQDVGVEAAVLNPGTSAKTADVDATARLGAAGELTQGARPPDMLGPKA